VRKALHEWSYLSIICIVYAYTMHTLPEGFEGDALILDASQPRASALEQSSRSICLCHWTMGDPGMLTLSVEVSVLPH
jgi:hypothetical protein